MADLLSLEIFTLRKQVLCVETPAVTLPGSEGELGILPQHVPLLTTLDSGILQFESEGQHQKAAVHYGYAQVRDDRVTVLTGMAELGDHIDLDRARQAEQRARDALQALIARHGVTRTQMDKLEAKLRRSIVRQRAGQ